MTFALAPFLLLPALLAAPQDAAPAQPAPAASTQPELLEATVQVDGGAPLEVRFGFDGTQGVTAYPLSTEGRPGVSAVVGGFARSPGAKGKSGLSFLFFMHFYADGGSFLEVQIANDAMVDAPGKVDATYKVSFKGAPVSEGKRTFLDETALTLWAGTPRFAPRTDLWQKYTADFPDAKAVGPVPKALAPDSRNDAERVEDPDPTKDTHSAGSPRNRYWAVQAVRYYLTDDARYLERLMDFVAAQGERPYHLSEASGEPFFHEAHPEAWFIEGRPEMKTYRETFGRMMMTPDQVEKGKANGWDHEHMNVEELYAAYVTVGSRIARRELVLIAEQLLSTAIVREKDHSQHSARAFGWVARMFVRAFDATGQQRYLEAVRKMMDSVRAHWIPDGTFKGFVPQDPKPDHMADKRWESPFMVAIATSAIALYLEAEPTDTAARDMLIFCGDLLVDQGYSEAQGGFYYDYSLDDASKSHDGHDINGVVFFIPSALVEVAEHLPPEKATLKEKYLAPARRVFQADAKEGWATPKQIYWYTWFVRAAKEFK